MRQIWRDRIATLLVAVAALVYVLWLVGWALPGLSGPKVVGAVVFGLGFAACPMAGLPDLEMMVREHRRYVIATSLVGLAALVLALTTVLTGNHTTLTLLVVATVGLWAVATYRHTVVMPDEVPMSEWDRKFEEAVRRLTAEADDRGRVVRH